MLLAVHVCRLVTTIPLVSMCKKVNSAVHNRKQSWELCSEQNIAPYGT